LVGATSLQGNDSRVNVVVTWNPASRCKTKGEGVAKGGGGTVQGRGAAINRARINVEFRFDVLMEGSQEPVKVHTKKIGLLA